MSNTTYMASRRAGGKGSCADSKRRISATITETAFLALRARADASHRGLSGEAADIIERAVVAPEHSPLPEMTPRQYAQAGQFVMEGYPMEDATRAAVEGREP